MNRLTTCVSCNSQQLVHIQIRVRCRSITEREAFSGSLYMQTVSIAFRIYRHRGNSHGIEGSNDAGCDSASIGNQDFVDPAHVSITDSRSVVRWAWDHSHYRDCSTAGNWKSVQQHPSSPSFQRTCPAQICRPQKSAHPPV